MLWYFVIFLDFFFSIYNQIGWAKIHSFPHNFLVLSFCLFFLMHNFKTGNNFSPKICCENFVDIKNKISNWDLPQLEIKNITKKFWHFIVFLSFFFVWHFVMFLGFFFCLVKFDEPKFIVLGTIFFNWLFIFIFLNARLEVVSPI